ncbi:hypothetical protein MBLNU457_4395t2 [Dothideomycetes sp. NU457]
MADGSDISEVSILLLGDSEVGKSAFLSRLCGGLNTPFKALPGLKDLEQPFSFDIRFTRKTFRLEFYDTSSPTSYTLLRPDVIVLCYAINDRETLTSVHKKWKYLVETHFNYDELIPVLLIGLKRDLRCEGVEGIHHYLSTKQSTHNQPQHHLLPHQNPQAPQNMCEYERALAHCQHHLYDRRSKPCDVYYATGTCKSDIDKTLRVISRVYNEEHFCPDCRDTSTDHAEEELTEVEEGAAKGQHGNEKGTKGSKLGGVHWRDIGGQKQDEEKG